MKQEIVIPTTLAEIPINNYQRFLKTANNSNDEQFIKYKLIECFCGIELANVRLMKQVDIDDISSHIDRLFNQSYPFVNRFKFGNSEIEFAFIPNLEKISGGEYADLENYMADWSTMHKAMAVMYRPIVDKRGEKYEIAPYTGSHEFSELMKLAPTSIAIGATLFFWNLGKELSQHILPYLELPNHPTWKTSALQHNSQVNGVGSFGSDN